MCMIYGSGERRYVRLCYRKGPRCGEHVPAPEGLPDPRTQRGCIPLRGRRDEMVVFKLTSSESTRTCLCCSNPSVSHHETLCAACRGGYCHKCGTPR